MKRLGLPLVVALMCAWQASLWRSAADLDPRYDVAASVGVCWDVRNFFVFAYHFHEFPVGSWMVYGREERSQIEALVRDHGQTLVQDFNSGCNTRFGDWGKVLLFWPTAWWTGSPASPSFSVANGSLFIAALGLFLVAFWRAGYPVLAILVVVFLGSNPFQLHEAYARDNVFSWPISITILVAALQAGVIVRGADRRALLIAAVTGSFVGCAREVRTEAALVGVAVPVVYLALSGPWRRKVALVAVFLSSFITTGQIWRVTFERALRSAQTFVARAGGHPFPGRWTLHHPIWHAIYTGLEDFSHGTKGYVGWDDRVAFRYAAPLLRERYGLDFTYRDGEYYFVETYDPESRYHVSPLDLSEYGAILREKIVRDIWEDPLWYLSGLGERSGRILRDTTPLSLAVGGWHAGLPLSGWIVAPTVLVALVLRRRVLLSVVVLTLPLSLIALLVVSDFGTTHYSIFHLVSVAVWGQLLFEGAAAIRGKAWKTTMSRQSFDPRPSAGVDDGRGVRA
jgi:hypothetical protein